MIAPEQAAILADGIKTAAADLNELIKAAAMQGVNISVKAEGETHDHYWYKIVRVNDPVIDLSWEPPGTYAKEDAE